MRKLILVFYLCSSLLSFAQEHTSTAILYNQTFSPGKSYPELTESNLKLSQQGLELNEKGKWIQLNKYYSIANRLIRYHVKLGADAEMSFKSHEGDFNASIDMSSKQIQIGKSPMIFQNVDFLDSNHEYLVEIVRDNQYSGMRIIDLFTGKSTELFGNMDGQGGVGRGVEHSGKYMGLQHDYYCFGLTKGTSAFVKQIIVESKYSELTLLIYGDSITEPEGYFPSKDFPDSWTQLIINRVQGKAMSSGRGGTTIQQVLERIKNELPFVKAKYVMVTIGTNGGNTEDNLSELMTYIKSQGAIPILNNIPANESNTHIDANVLIEKVRQKFNIKGAKFDVATSANFDGKAVEQSTMYFEDYDWGKIYHHPNVKGSKLMFLRTLIDVPEIYQ